MDIAKKDFSKTVFNFERGAGMTREDAVKALEIELNKWEADCKSYHAVKEALPMAIEALENENALIDRVLEVIDSEAWSYCDYIIKHENGNSDKQVAASLLSENIREAVLALKGGEQE